MINWVWQCLDDEYLKSNLRDLTDLR